MKKLLMTTLLLGTSLTTLAGDKGGNGGDVVVCPTYTSLLDHIEGESRGIYYNLDSEGTTYKEQLEVAFKRVEKHAQGLSIDLRKRATPLINDIDNFIKDLKNDPDLVNQRSSLYPNTNFTTDDLVDISDSIHTTIPVGCHIEQVAIQKKPKLYGERLFTINKKNFLNLDDKGIAGLVLHEVLYQVYLEKEWSKDSTEARSLNTLISSDIVENLSFLEFLEVLKNASFHTFVFNGVFTSSRAETKQINGMEVVALRTYSANGSSAWPMLYKEKSKSTLPITGFIEGKMEITANSFFIINPTGKNDQEKLAGLLGGEYYNTIFSPARNFTGHLHLGETNFIRFEKGKLLLTKENISKIDPRYGFLILVGIMKYVNANDYNSYRSESIPFGKCILQVKKFLGFPTYYMKNQNEIKRVKEKKLLKTAIGGFCD